jgi:hypothetical protein
VYHEIEPNPSKDRAMHDGNNPSFLNECIKFKAFLTVQYISISSSKFGSCVKDIRKVRFLLSAYVDFLFNGSFYGQLKGKIKISITFHANI